MTQPKIIIIAGPNGAGKTTFAREFLPQEAGCPVFVNADLIAAGLSPFAPERAALQAGRLTLAAIAQHVAKRESFAFETTLSGKAYATQIPGVPALGGSVDSLRQRGRRAGAHQLERQTMTTPKHVSEPVPSYGQVPADANADFRGSLAAIKRAAVRARQLAEQTGTDLIVVRGGKVVRVPPKEKPSS
jgi:hypothetical protein